MVPYHVIFTKTGVSNTVSFSVFSKLNTTPTKIMASDWLFNFKMFLNTVQLVIRSACAFINYSLAPSFVNFIHLKTLEIFKNILKISKNVLEGFRRFLEVQAIFLMSSEICSEIYGMCAKNFGEMLKNFHLMKVTNALFINAQNFC